MAGDLGLLHCDAWLLPTDEVFNITASFGHYVGLDGGGRLEGYDWSDAQRVVRHHTESNGPLIWLGRVGTGSRSADWFAGVIGPFVAQAVDALGPHPPGRPHLLAVNVVGTGHGGGWDVKGLIFAALLRSMLAAAEEHGVDLALVCWGHRAYSAAQRVRRQLLNADDPSECQPKWNLGEQAEHLVATAQQLAVEARRDKLVLFLGAGVSAGAGLPAWQGLLDAVAASLPEDRQPPLALLHRHDVRDQAAILQARLGTDKATLHEAVRRHTACERYTLLHGLLASLPSTKAITTNYDLLFEQAARAIDRGDDLQDRLAVLPYQPANDADRWLLKLHGSIDQDESIVLTRSDYLALPERHGALIGLVQAMLLTHHMLFVGYSLSDEDFHQLVYEVEAARGSASTGPIGTVLTLFDDPLFTDLWDRTVRVVPMHRMPAADEPTEAELNEAARRLQILCDLIAFESADLDAFLLDRTYWELLDQSEQALATSLRQLKESIATMKATESFSPALRRVQQLLDELGGSGTRPPSWR